MKYIVLVGAPGAGKGTQAKLLEKRFSLPQISSGDLFRHNLTNQTELGKLAKSFMDRGELVPDDVTIAMVRERLSQPDCENGGILDGFPRTIAQAQALDNLLADFNGHINVVPYIRVEQDVLVNRLVKRAEIEGRTDDNLNTIQNRMRVYFEQTAPILEYYRVKGLLVEVDGGQSVEAVQSDLCEVIEAA